jgi:hypothetical protein
MRKGLIATVVFIAVLIFGGFSSAREHQMDRGSRHMKGGGEKGHHGMMGPGMGMMGPGMGMMGPMMGSPEIMGTMMAIHGEIMSLMGEMMQKYGRAMDQMTPEVRQQMQQEVLKRLGEILGPQGRGGRFLPLTFLRFLIKKRDLEGGPRSWAFERWALC